MAPVPVFKNGTNVRRGGSTKGSPDNILGAIDAGDYNAIGQCAGEQITEGENTNFWWVLLDTPVGQGWVSAVRINLGGNDQPIPGVPSGPTHFAWG
ncbi:MAG: hypothetical protein EKK42_18555 [Pseudonocardiaceae bacterium]|nr:MAG: hypothetical protein EKK42_18555 [Pseudonocardiaceae bacterium]